MNQTTIEVLVVEDDAGDVRLLEEMIYDINMGRTPYVWLNLEKAKTLKQAEEQLLSHRFDVILLDLSLPDSLGLKTITRTLEIVPRLPIIVMSGQKDERVAMQAVQAGAQDYLVKGYVDSYGLERAIRYAIERKQNELALRESEERFRALIENSVDVITLVNEQGKILYLSPSFDRVMGHSALNHIGQSYLSLVHPDDCLLVQQTLDAVLRQEGQPVQFDFRCISSSGEVRWIEATAANLFKVPSVKAIVINYRDVTERKASTEQINRRMNELEAIYENGLALARLLEPNVIGQKIIEVLSQKLNWHHAAVRLYRPNTNTIELAAFNRAGTSLEEHHQEIERLQKMISKPGQGLSGWVIQNGVSVICEDTTHDARYTATFPDIRSGLYVPIRTGSATIGCISVESKTAKAFDRYDERLLSTVATQAAIAIENARLFQEAQVDLVERRRVEEALRELNDQLEQRVVERTEELRRANRALEQASRMKDEFLASMSHELRTPLTGILNLSEALQEQVFGELNNKQLQFLSTIESSGRHLLGLINDILDLSKIEAGQFEMQFDLCVAGDLCHSSLQLVKSLAQKKKQNLSFTIDPAFIDLKADPRRLKQMLVNLLSNAVKFTPEYGQVGLSVKADAENDLIHFTVWDTGIGIAAEDMPRLFQPFTQLDSSLSRQHPGSGLGLALVHRMAILHGGSVSLDSRPGEGSRFTITLPWKKAETPAAPALVRNPQPVPQAVPAFRTTKPLLLLADDNEINLETYSDYLCAKGYQVAIAHNGEEAIDTAKSLHPDLILMDIQMPGMSGLEAIQHIRASGHNGNGNGSIASVPILALTALAMPGDREKCLAAGANDYLSKPVALSNLLHTINELISHKS